VQTTPNVPPVPDVPGAAVDPSRIADLESLIVNERPCTLVLAELLEPKLWEK
jgi:hypothetical protein